MDRYFAIENTVYSNAWVKEHPDGSKTRTPDMLICVCPEGINAALVAKKLSLGDIALCDPPPTKQYPENEATPEPKESGDE